MNDVRIILNTPQSIMYINGPIPNCRVLLRWLKLHDYGLTRIAKDSHRYELPYLAWEVVRKNRNPFFMTGTGFEGYYIGISQSADEVLDAIIFISRNVLDNITRRYRVEYSFQSHLMMTLTGELSDPKAIEVWSAELGATIARLRCDLHHNPMADQFRVETYRIVKSLPNISYYENSHRILNNYSVGSQSSKLKAYVSMNSVQPADQDAWLVAWSIGRFGHPLVREYLEYTYSFLPRTFF